MCVSSNGMNSVHPFGDFQEGINIILIDPNFIEGRINARLISGILKDVHTMDFRQCDRVLNYLKKMNALPDLMIVCESLKEEANTLHEFVEINESECEIYYMCNGQTLAEDCPHTLTKIVLIDQLREILRTKFSS